MSLQDNMITIENSKCKNKSFSILENEFTERQWTLQKNELDHIIFKSPNSDYDYFEIKIDKTTIYVTVPLKNSRINYTTQFKSYYQASEFAEMHLKDFST